MAEYFVWEGILKNNRSVKKINRSFSFREGFKIVSLFVWFFYVTKINKDYNQAVKIKDIAISVNGQVKETSPIFLP